MRIIIKFYLYRTRLFLFILFYFIILFYFYTFRTIAQYNNLIYVVVYNGITINLYIILYTYKNESNAI